MTITREVLEKRKSELEKTQVQLAANLNATSGALQLIDSLLKDLDLPEVKE